ncbi:MAG: 5-dehydro-2-deoxygluconokinase [Infirmifilum sp.]
MKEEAEIDVVLIGRVGIDLYSDDLGNDLINARHFVKYVGGTVANTAVGCARYGAKVAVISRVSSDPLGKFIKSFLERNGVIVKYIKEDPEAMTGLVFAAIIPGKEPEYIFYRPPMFTADLRITKDDIDEELIRNTKILVVTGTGLSANPSYETNIYVINLAKKYNKIILFNLDWRPTLWKNVSKEERLKRYQEVLRLSDIIVGGVPEWRAATDKESIEDALATVKNLNKNLIGAIITRGEEGLTAYWNNKKIDIQPIKVNVLKTLGAGDAFLAAFLYGYLYLMKLGWSIEQVLEFANAAAAIVVTRHSCSEAMPTYDEVMSVLKSRKI